MATGPGDLPLIVVGGCLRQQVRACSHCFAAVTHAYFGCERFDHLWYVRGQVSDALPPERQPQSGVETLEDLHELRCAGYQDQGLDPRGPARHPLGEARVLDTPRTARADRVGPGTELALDLSAFRRHACAPYRRRDEIHAFGVAFVEAVAQILDGEGERVSGLVTPT